MDRQLWVRTTPTLDPLGGSDGYTTVIEVGQDFVRELGEAEVFTYVEHVAAVVARARYEHAWLRMGQERLGLDLHSTGLVLRDLRQEAGELPASGVVGLTWAPLTSVTADGPQTTLFCEGLGTGQLSAAEAADHLMNVLEGQHAARLDEAMLRTLVTHVQLDEDTARAAVAGLSEYRERG